MATPIKAVLVGCGGMSGAWLGPAKEIPELEVVGLVDLREEAARQRAAEFGLTDAAIGTDLKAMLEQTEPDVVFDCTVPEAHTPNTLIALGHGCHVLGEKPMSDSLDNARKAVAAAENAGKIYAVIQNYRYNAQIRRLRQFLQSSELGKLTTLNADFYIGAHFGGFRDRMEHVLLLDMAIHTFDAARFITGADPVSVYCKEWNPTGSWYDHDASAVAVFEMTDGIVFTYRGSWCAEGLNTSWNSEWRAVGQKGSAKWDGGGQFAAQAVEKAGGFFSEHREPEMATYDDTKGTGGHGGILREFLGCVRNGGTPETVCTDNIKSLAMVFGAIESAKRGQPVQIEV